MTACIAVLLTCHNRRDHTLACLRALSRQRVDGCTIRPFVVDAASTDGTPEAIATEFPQVTVIRGCADLFWNRGMHVAFARAAVSSPDAFLWLNDDTLLDEGAVSTLVETENTVAQRTGRRAIVAGSARDPTTGKLTYGGVRRNAPATRPLRFSLVEPSAEPRQCETMNGNCVLVPREIVEKVGVLDPVFTHHMGDYDYGLRACRAGFTVWITAETIATCARNQPAPRRGFRSEARALRGPKGLPPGEWAWFARRWAGPLWPMFAISPYVRRFARCLRG